MGFFKRLFGRMGGGTAAAGSLVSRGSFSYENRTLASNETIFSAVSMLSGAIASLPVTLRQRYRRMDPSEHEVARLLEFGFNPNMTAFQFIRCMEVLRNSTGAGYALKELNAWGGVEALWLMKTNFVEPKIDRESRELYYQVRDGIDGDTVYLHNSMVVALGHISSDGLKPINPIDVLRSSLDYDREVKEFSIDQMQNGLRANLVIKISGNLNKEQLDAYNEILRAFKRSGILYLDAGKEIKELTNGSVIDPKVFEVENITIARVARVYTIPLDKFLPDKTSYNSAEQSDLNYLRDTILPIVRMYEQEFTKKLLSIQERMAGMQVKFSLNGFARADMQTRGEFYMKGIRTGWFCLDDVRGLEDLPPLPDGEGKGHFISRDLILVNTLLTGSRDEGNGSRPSAAQLAPAAPGDQISRVSLNGAQINSILQIIMAVTGGAMEFEAAVTLLTSAFPFDRTVAIQILGHPENLRTTEGSNADV